MKPHTFLPSDKRIQVSYCCRQLTVVRKNDRFPTTLHFTALTHQEEDPEYCANKLGIAKKKKLNFMHENLNLLTT